MAGLEEALAQSKGADYWRCALQVNPYEYCVKYKGGAPAASESDYNSQIVEACVKAAIKVVGIADHGSVEHIDSLRGALEDVEIVVFPGFEIASAEKIHMVCLFEPGATRDDLNQKLGALWPPTGKEADKKPTSPSKHSCLRIARDVLEMGGVWYAAHMTGKNGLLRLSGAGDNFTDTWCNSDLVLAGQIPGGLDALEVTDEEKGKAANPNITLKKYKEIIENKNPDYKRDRPIAIINAKDVCGGADLANPSASCRIKMTEPTAEALKQAFLDPESRILLASETDDERFAQIIAGAWNGGYLDGLRVHFSENLNTLIGGRGTGKSTVIETMRYALDLSPSSSDARKVHDDIVKGNLGNGGSVELLVRSREHMGKVFSVSRRYGEPSTVRTKNGKPSSLTPHDLFPELQVLGQNEILDIANDDLAIKDLLHGLLPDTNQWLAKLADLRSRLESNREALVTAWEDQDEIEFQVNELPKIKEQIDHYKDLGLEKKLANSTKLNKEQQLVDLVNGYIEGVGDSLEGLRECIEDELEGFEAEDLKDYPGKQFLAGMKKAVNTFAKNASPKLEEIEKQLAALQESQEELEGKWGDNVETVKTALAEAIGELPDSAGKKGSQIGREYLALVKQQDEAQPLKKVLKGKKAAIKALEEERFQLLNEWREAQNEQFDVLRKGAKKLHKKHLKGKLQMEPIQWGNRSPLKDFLVSIDGIGEKKVVWVDKVESLSIATLVKKIEEGKDALLDEYKEFGLTSAVANSLAKLSDEEVLELEEVDLQTRVELRLNVSDQTENYRPIHKLSTGQKCTAILHLLLLEGHEPLIVDQPEDNLDNAFIADRIVTELRAAKRRRQFIFSTHNANIPVFGDSEWIGALREEEGRGVLSGSSVGSIDTDSVRELVSHILEGGKEAFDIRRAKYGY